MYFYIRTAAYRIYYILNDISHNCGMYWLWSMSQVSSGGIVSYYGLDDWAIVVRSPAGAKDFSYSLFVQTGPGAHPASCTMGSGVLSPGRDADHSPPSSAEVKYE
jgi:hypothetical protein